MVNQELPPGNLSVWITLQSARAAVLSSTNTRPRSMEPQTTCACSTMRLRGQMISSSCPLRLSRPPCRGDGGAPPRLHSSGPLQVRHRRAACGGRGKVACHHDAIGDADLSFVPRIEGVKVRSRMILPVQCRWRCRRRPRSRGILARLSRSSDASRPPSTCRTTGRMYLGLNSPLRHRTPVRYGRDRRRGFWTFVPEGRNLVAGS
jgi:hypothetical protein